MTRSSCTDAAGRARAAAWLAVALLAGSSPSAAQTAGADDSGSQPHIRIGALSLAPSISIPRAGIETNVFNTVEPRSDFALSVSPRLDTRLGIRRRARLAATFIGGVEHFRTFASERSFNPDFRSRLEVPLRRFTLTVGGDYLRTRSRFDDVVDLRARRTVSEVSGGVSVRLSPKLSLGANVGRARWRFDADALFDGTSLAETLNRNERNGGFSLSWRRTALSTFTLNTDFHAARFVRSPDRDSRSLAVTAGGEFHPRALISGSAFIGVRRFTAVGSDVSDATPIVASADLSYRFPTGTTLTLEAARDIAYSYRRDDPIYLASRYGVAATQRMGASFDLTGRIVRGVYDHRGGSGRRDDGRLVEVTVGRRAGPRSRIGFRVGYRSRKSAAARWRYSGLEAGLVFDY